MDGLTIRQGQKLINQGSTASEIKSQDFNIAKPSMDKNKDVSFADSLNKAIQDTNQLQQIADKKMQALATGKTTDIPDVLVAAEKADIALRLMTQMRNKFIEAYQEIMKMQV